MVTVQQNKDTPDRFLMITAHQTFAKLPIVRGKNLVTNQKMIFEEFLSAPCRDKEMPRAITSMTKIVDVNDH